MRDVLSLMQHKLPQKTLLFYSVLNDPRLTQTQILTINTNSYFTQR